MQLKVDAAGWMLGIIGNKGDVGGLYLERSASWIRRWMLVLGVKIQVAIGESN